MMGNRKIKIIPVKTGCWEAGNRMGLQRAAGSREALTQAVWGKTPTSHRGRPTPKP